MGITAAQLIPEMLRSGRGGDPIPIAAALIPSLCLIALACVASLLVYRTPAPETDLPCTWRLAAIGIIFAVFLGCRLTHWLYLLNGVSNEDRSLMIGGHEVHHIAWSTLVLWLLVGVKQGVRRFTVFLALATAAILGSMGDEYAYMLHVDHLLHDDVFYASAWSLMGAGLTCASIATLVGTSIGDFRRKGQTCSMQGTE